MADFPKVGATEMPKWAHYPADVRSDEVAMATADTEYSWAIPNGCREFALTLQDSTIPWRYSAETGEVAAVGGGTPRAAGQSIEYNAGFYDGTVYFAHSAGAAQVMRIEYAVVGP